MLAHSGTKGWPLTYAEQRGPTWAEEEFLSAFVSGSRRSSAAKDQIWRNRCPAKVKGFMTHYTSYRRHPKPMALRGLFQI